MATKARARKPAPKKPRIVMPVTPVPAEWYKQMQSARQYAGKRMWKDAAKSALLAADSTTDYTYKQQALKFATTCGALGKKAEEQ